MVMTGEGNSELKLVSQNSPRQQYGCFSSWGRWQLCNARYYIRELDSGGREGKQCGAGRGMGMVDISRIERNLPHDEALCKRCN